MARRNPGELVVARQSFKELKATRKRAERRSRKMKSALQRRDRKELFSLWAEDVSDTVTMMPRVGMNVVNNLLSNPKGQYGIQVTCPGYTQENVTFFPAHNLGKQYLGTEYHGSGRRSVSKVAYDFSSAAKLALDMLLSAKNTTKCSVLWLLGEQSKPVSWDWLEREAKNYRGRLISGATTPSAPGSWSVMRNNPPDMLQYSPQFMHPENWSKDKPRVDAARSPHCWDDMWKAVPSIGEARLARAKILADLEGLPYSGPPLDPEYGWPVKPGKTMVKILEAPIELRGFSFFAYKKALLAFVQQPLSAESIKRFSRTIKKLSLAGRGNAQAIQKQKDSYSAVIEILDYVLDAFEGPLVYTGDASPTVTHYSAGREYARKIHAIIEREKIDPLVWYLNLKIRGWDPKDYGESRPPKYKRDLIDLALEYDQGNLPAGQFIWTSYLLEKLEQQYKPSLRRDFDAMFYQEINRHPYYRASGPKRRKEVCLELKKKYSRNKGMKSAPSKAKSNPHGSYPFAKKEEQYRGYSLAQLTYAQRDAHKAAQAMRGVDKSSELWYLDDLNTISNELYRRRRAKPNGRQPIPERKIQALQKWRSKLSPAHPDSRSCRGLEEWVNPSIKEMKALLKFINFASDVQLRDKPISPASRALEESVPYNLRGIFYEPAFLWPELPMAPWSHYPERLKTYDKNLIAFARRSLGRKSIKRFVDQIRKLIRLSQADVTVVSEILAKKLAEKLAKSKSKNVPSFPAEYRLLFQDDKYPGLKIGLTKLALAQIGTKYHHCLGQVTGFDSTPRIGIEFPDTEVYYFEYDTGYTECKKDWNASCTLESDRQQIVQELRAKYSSLAKAAAEFELAVNEPEEEKEEVVEEEEALKAFTVERNAYEAVIKTLKFVAEALSSPVVLVSETKDYSDQEEIRKALAAAGIDPLRLFLLESYGVIDLVYAIHTKQLELPGLREDQGYDLLEYLEKWVRREYPGARQYVMKNFHHKTNLDEMYSYIVEHFGQDSMRSQYDREGFSRKSRKGQSGSGVSTVRRTRRKASKERTHQKRRARKSMERQGVAKWNPARREWLRNNPKPSGAKFYAEVMAHLKAIKWLYWTTHWKSMGPNFYGTHLMLQRLYEGVDKPIDELGERIVAYFGSKGLDPIALQRRSVEVIQDNMSSGPLETLLSLERKLQFSVKQAWEHEKSSGEDYSLGLDDWLMSLSNDRDTAIYLLQQAIGQ